MSGHRPFAELRKAMTPERRTRNAEGTKGMLNAMLLREQRQGSDKVPAALTQDPISADCEQDF